MANDKFTPKTSSTYDFKDNVTLLGVDAAFENLFDTSLTNTSESPDLVDFPLQNITGIDIPSLGFNLQKSTLTRKAHISADTVIHYDQVIIHFLENKEFSVATFFEKWKSHYYDEARQNWISGKTNKYISLKVRIAPSADPPLDLSISDGDKPIDMVIDLRNLTLPKTMPRFSLEYSKADPIKYSIPFVVENVDIQRSRATQIRTTGVQL